MEMSGEHDSGLPILSNVRNSILYLTLMCPSAYATVFFQRQTYEDNELLRDIEDRIARLTMIRQAL